MRYHCTLRSLRPQRVMSVRAVASREELPAAIARHLGDVWEYVARAGGRASGPPFTRYFRADGDTFDFEAGVPVEGPLSGDGRIQPGELPGGDAVTTLHVGPYDTLPEAEQALAAWAGAHGREPAGPSWEIYLTEPSLVADPEEWETEVVKPLRPAG